MVVRYTKSRFVNTNEHIPSEQGKTQYRHIYEIPSAQEFPVSKIKKVFHWALYRAPMGWSDDSTKERNSLIYDLWQIIAICVFLTATRPLVVLGENIAGLRGPNSAYSDGDYFQRDPTVTIDQNSPWTSFILMLDQQSFLRMGLIIVYWETCIRILARTFQMDTINVHGIIQL